MNQVICVGVHDQAEASQCLAELLVAPLRAGKTVTWLISGGSSLPIAKQAVDILRATDCSRLHVGLVDDFISTDPSQPSNYEQLLALGFSLPAAEIYPLIQPNTSPSDCADNYAEKLAEWLAASDFSIGQFGIGEGYHTGGIQPGSPAASEHDTLAIAYDDGGVTRITVTPALTARLAAAFINSFGDSKRPLIEHFLESQADILTEPTQALKTAGSTYLYSDA